MSHPQTDLSLWALSRLLLGVARPSKSPPHIGVLGNFRVGVRLVNKDLSCWFCFCGAVFYSRSASPSPAFPCGGRRTSPPYSQSKKGWLSFICAPVWQADCVWLIFNFLLLGKCTCGCHHHLQPTQTRTGEFSPLRAGAGAQKQTQTARGSYLELSRRLPWESRSQSL